jgi:hypothetical protein
MKHLALLAAAGSLAAVSAPAHAAELPAPASPFAVSYSSAGFDLTPVARWGDDDWDDDDDWRERRRWRDRGRHRDWDDDRRYWRGNDGRWRCRRDDGTVGLLIGAGVGALVGRQIDTRGDRTLGTVLGAVGGGLLGREVDRGVRCR